jgi:acyl dehydratase
MVPHSAPPVPAAASSAVLLGASDWITITQEDVRAFGVLTRSSERLHDDPDWAAAHSPFGTTIAHGFQLLALLTAFLADVRPWASTDPDPAGAGGDPGTGTGGRVSVNYGFDRVRFITPVRVGARVRGVFEDLGSQPAGPGRTLSRLGCRIEIEGEARPAVIADWLGLSIDTV